MRDLEELGRKIERVSRVIRGLEREIWKLAKILSALVPGWGTFGTWEVAGNFVNGGSPAAV